MYKEEDVSFKHHTMFKSSAIAKICFGIAWRKNTFSLLPCYSVLIFMSEKNHVQLFQPEKIVENWKLLCCFHIIFLLISITKISVQSILSLSSWNSQYLLQWIYSWWIVDDAKLLISQIRLFMLPHLILWDCILKLSQ